MSIKNKFEKWFYLDDEEKEVQEQPRREEQRPVQEQPRGRAPMRKQVAGEPQQSATVVSLQSVQKSSKVILIEPRVYAEAQDISEHLKNKRAVVVNLQRIERDQGIRIVDFLSGTVYALGGDIQRIGTDIFLCVPENVEVAGAISDYFER
ncbi:cell division protein SepF [Sporosarcina sp. E16_3]|uniref:cell division protein SepF n=1 Tax=unclassified Sporosarcina TaxID=2647733 RepID=UPI00164602B9|nr:MULTISPECIES: cell division protein SepF [unclassified Sporosarcina]MBO0601008.1 cell division protein SepF [Sporosarcina sp. E16_3]